MLQNPWRRLPFAFLMSRGMKNPPRAESWTCPLCALRTKEFPEQVVRRLLKEQWAFLAPEGFTATARVKNKFSAAVRLQMNYPPSAIRKIC
jgi:hypothetical protein